MWINLGHDEMVDIEHFCQTSCWHVSVYRSVDIMVPVVMPGNNFTCQGVLGSQLRRREDHRYRTRHATMHWLVGDDYSQQIFDLHS